MAKRELTTKQQRFKDVYDGNATDAARKAGYKGNDKTLEAVGRQNLANPRIRAAIEAREKKRSHNDHILTRKERQAFWTRVAIGEELQRVVLGKGKNRTVVEVGPKMQDRLKASELLGRSQADFVERHEHSLSTEVLQGLFANLNLPEAQVVALCVMLTGGAKVGEIPQASPISAIEHKVAGK